MRISYWSSDVCSSDLSAEDGNNVYELDAATADRFLHIKIIPTIDGFVEHGIENKFHPLILAFIRNHPGCFLQSEVDIQNGNVARPSPRSQIGRASCRERVCQYV